MIDTHCHIDLFEDPMEIANECEKMGIITIGMTNLPSHFELGYRHLFSFQKVRLALGMHPLNFEMHKSEFPKFLRNLDNTSYIGEIGLDFSKEGLESKDIQSETFDNILKALQGRKKILSLHSRGAERNVLNYLGKYQIKAAIFHWYTGPILLIKEIIEAGYFFSVNPAMVKSKSGQTIISRIPIHRVLTESDGPFIEVNSRKIRPRDVPLVYNYLSSIHGMTEKEIEIQIESNFRVLLQSLK